MPLIEPSADSLPHTLDILARLQSGQPPSPDELEDAPLIDRWVRLGTPALPDQRLPDNDTVMRCAVIGLAFDGRPDVGAAIRALAGKMRDDGLDMVGYLLDLAALEADAARWPERLEHIGNHAAALHRRGSERKAKRARERVF